MQNGMNACGLKIQMKWWKGITKRTKKMATLHVAILFFPHSSEWKPLIGFIWTILRILNRSVTFDVQCYPTYSFCHNRDLFVGLPHLFSHPGKIHLCANITWWVIWNQIGHPYRRISFTNPSQRTHSCLAFESRKTKRTYLLSARQHRKFKALAIHGWRNQRIWIRCFCSWL